MMRARRQLSDHSHHLQSMDSVDSAAPKPKGTHGGKRVGSGRKKKVATVGNPVQSSSSQPRHLPRAPTHSVGTGLSPIPPQSQSAAPFFGPYNTNQAAPSVDSATTSAPTRGPAFWSGIWRQNNVPPAQPGLGNICTYLFHYYS